MRTVGVVAVAVGMWGCWGVVGPAHDRGSAPLGSADAAPTGVGVGVLRLRGVGTEGGSPATGHAGGIPGKAASPSGAPSADATSDGVPPAPGWWHPSPGVTWDWQLVVPIDQSAMVDVYDIDAVENGADGVTSLHTQGRKVICYVDLGSWESYRPDASTFPIVVLGATYVGYPDERWLDIRRRDLLTPIVRSRLDMAKTKGCDAVEADNMDGYDTNTHESSGFPLTYQDQIAYNRFVASEAHARGMAIALKNDIFQVKDLVSDFDMELNEQCFQYSECNLVVPFVLAPQPAFGTEYSFPACHLSHQ